jgi:hypothetical protein
MILTDGGADQQTGEAIARLVKHDLFGLKNPRQSVKIEV